MLIEHFWHFWHFFLHFLAQFSHVISPDVPGLIDLKFYVRHPGEGLYQSYGNYADAAILSAERQGLLFLAAILAAAYYGYLSLDGFKYVIQVLLF